MTEETPTTIYKSLLQEPLAETILQTIQHLRRQSQAYLDRELNTKQRQVA